MTPTDSTRILQSGGGDAAEHLRVFVAEGSASDLFWLEMVFKSSRLPYSIEVATNVPAAKRYLEQHADSNRPDLVFLDAFEMLQELPTAANVPLFMLTNSASPAERENFRKDFGDPAQRCIEKPFTRQKLSDCLVAADLDTWATRLSAR